MLIQTHLDQRALEYVRQQLALGSSYANLLMKSGLEGGICSAYLPADIKLDQIVDYSLSTYISLGKKLEGSRDLMLKEIMQHLNLLRGACAIVETFMEASSDALSKKRIPYLTYQEEVYYVLSRNSTSQLIETALADSRVYPKLIGLTSYDENIESGKSLSYEDLEKMAARAKVILVGAFDEEGFIAWHRLV